MPSINSKLSAGRVVMSSASVRNGINSKVLDIQLLVELPDPEEPPVEEPPAVSGSFSNDFNNDFN